MPRLMIPHLCFKSLAPMRALLVIHGIILFLSPVSTFGQCNTSGFGATTTFLTGAQPSAIVAGDFNSDGKVDVATAGGNSDSGSVAVLLGNGKGGFGPPSESGVSSNHAAGKSPGAVVAGDFNKDGALDLATANYSSQNISVLLGDGTGLFSRERIQVFPLGGVPTSIAASDFNRDGNLDLVTSHSFNAKGGRVTVLLGDGTGKFSGSNGQPENIYSLAYDSPNSIATGDFNGDTQPDFVVVSSHQATYPNVPSFVSVFMGDGKGNFAAANDLKVVTNRDQTVRSVGPHGIAVADFNRDGKQDLVVGLSYMTLVYAGDGRGGFSVISMFEHGLSRSVAVGDANADLKPDIFRTINDTNNVSVSVGDGTGKFAAPASFHVAAISSDIAVSDFNSDGQHDLAGANAGSNNIWVLLNTCASSPPAKAPILMTAELSNQAIAFDSVTMLAGPFSVYTPYPNLNPDKRTRLMFFARDIDLTPGQTPLVTAHIEDSNHILHPLTVEVVYPVPSFNWLTQVVVKLPDDFISGADVLVSINVNGVDSNKAILNIKPSAAP